MHAKHISYILAYKRHISIEAYYLPTLIMARNKKSKKRQSVIAPGPSGLSRPAVLPTAEQLLEMDPSSSSQESSVENSNHSSDSSDSDADTVLPSASASNATEDGIKGRLLTLIRSKYCNEKMQHRNNPEWFPICFDPRAYTKLRASAKPNEILDHAHGKKLKNAVSKLVLSITKMPMFSTYKNMDATRINSIPEFDMLGNY